VEITVSGGGYVSEGDEKLWRIDVCLRQLLRALFVKYFTEVFPRIRFFLEKCDDAFWTLNFAFCCRTEEMATFLNCKDVLHELLRTVSL